MNHSLSLYLIESLSYLEKQSEDYALDVMTLVESILEQPKVILRKQLDKAKTQKMNEMKAEGIEYDRRMEELEKVEYPKPKEQFIYDTFNHFREKHPWILGDKY